MDLKGKLPEEVVQIASSTLPTQVGGFESNHVGRKVVLTLPLKIDGNGEIVTYFSPEKYAEHLEKVSRDAALPTERIDQNGTSVIKMTRRFNRLVGANGVSMALGTLGSWSANKSRISEFRDKEGDFSDALEFRGQPADIQSQVITAIPNGASALELECVATATYQSSTMTFQSKISGWKVVAAKSTGTKSTGTKSTTKKAAEVATPSA